jgi:hypothetical protein
VRHKLLPPGVVRIEERTNCPYADCGRENTVVSGFEGELPKAGDISVCWGCKRWGVFTDMGFLRCPTEAEIKMAERDPRLRAQLDAIVKARST